MAPKKKPQMEIEDFNDWDDILDEDEIMWEEDPELDREWKRALKAIEESGIN